MSVILTTSQITTYSGTTAFWGANSGGMLINHSQNLNDIGYFGTYKGVKMTRNEYFEQYINSDVLTVKLIQTQLEVDFTEKFLLIIADYIQ